MAKWKVWFYFEGDWEQGILVKTIWGVIIIFRWDMLRAILTHGCPPGFPVFWALSCHTAWKSLMDGQVGKVLPPPQFCK